MAGVEFLDSTGKSVTITDPDNFPRDISYFTFISSLNPHTVDPRAPNDIHQFEFFCAYLIISPIFRQSLVADPFYGYQSIINAYIRYSTQWSIG